MRVSLVTIGGEPFPGLLAGVPIRMNGSHLSKAFRKAHHAVPEVDL
jgi:hypothetical protein